MKSGTEIIHNKNNAYGYSKFLRCWSDQHGSDNGKFILAIVSVAGENYDGPYYIKEPFNHEPNLWCPPVLTMT